MSENTTQTLEDYILQKSPLIIAHRGYSEIAPENTISALRAAIKAGADACEFDVHRTQDGVLVVIHDDEVDRTTNGTGAIKELSYDYLASLDAGSWKDSKFKGEKIPTLEETLKYLKEHKMVAILESKDPNITDQILSLLDKTQMDQRTVLISFEEPVIARVKELKSHVPALLLLEDEGCMTGTTENKVSYISKKADALGTKLVGPCSFQLEKLSPQQLPQAKEDLEKGLDPGHLPLALDADTIKALHERGYLINAWTVDSKENMRELIKSKVDFLTTNYLERAIQIKKEAFQ